MKQIFTKLCALTIALACIVILFNTNNTTKAEYSASYVIDDNVFLSSTAMSVDDINNFLISKGSWLANYVIPEYVSVPYPLAAGGLANVNARQVNTVTGHILYNKTVAQLIYDECIEHNVNPRVILTILQKESTAITKSQPSSNTTRAWPLFYAYDEAMEACLKYGTSCNDSALREKSENFGGVGLQITYATAWFQKRFNTYSANRDFTVSVDGTTIVCQNASTRIMYIYTPHVGSWLNFYTIFTNWWEDPTYGPPPANQPFAMEPIKSLPAGSWNVANSTRTLSGNFNSDQQNDIASLYDYGNCSFGLFLFSSSNSFTPVNSYYSGPGSWCLSSTSNIVKGKFDSDNIDDIGAIYNYGNASIGLWVFESSNNFKPRMLKYIPAGNWNYNSNSELSSGDFDSDNIDDFAILYDYGNASIGLWVFESSNNFAAKKYYNSGSGSMYLNKTKSLVAGNLDGNGKDDLALIYDYGNTGMGLIFFQSLNNYQPNVKYSTNPGSWSVSSNSNLVLSLFDGTDTIDDLALIYDYGQQAVGIFVFNSSNNFIPQSKYWSGRRNFSMDATNKRIVAGDYNHDGKNDIAIMYSYGSQSMTLFSFNQT